MGISRRRCCFGVLSESGVVVVDNDRLIEDNFFVFSSISLFERDEKLDAVCDLGLTEASFK